MYQNSALSDMSKCIQVGGTASCTHIQPTGYRITESSHPEVIHKCIKVKHLGSSVYTHKLDRRDIKARVVFTS